METVIGKVLNLINNKLENIISKTKQKYLWAPLTFLLIIWGVPIYFYVITNPSWDLLVSNFKTLIFNSGSIGDILLRVFFVIMYFSLFLLVPVMVLVYLILYKIEIFIDTKENLIGIKRRYFTTSTEIIRIKKFKKIIIHKFYDNDQMIQAYYYGDLGDFTLYKFHNDDADLVYQIISENFDIKTKIIPPGEFRPFEFQKSKTIVDNINQVIE